MKNKTKITLTIGITALICLALLRFPITHGDLYEWTYASSSPFIEDWAVGVTAAGDSIYIANSRNNYPTYTSHFMRYNTNTGWSVRHEPPQPFKNSIAMAWDKENCIYVLPGASYGDIDKGGRFFFLRYNIGGNSWTQLQNTSHTNGPGDAMCFVPGWVLGVSDDNFLYAILGSHRPSGSKFYRYSIATNSWSSPLTSFPWSKTDDGCSLIWTGGNYLYALRGEWQESTACYNFSRYNIVNDTWESRAEIPAYPHSGGSGGVGDGGSLIWIGDPYSDYIYALSGNQAWPETPDPIWDKRFYLYFLSNNTWRPQRLADLPAGVGDQNGPRLGFANGKIYCWRGCNNDDDLYAYQLDFSPPEITIISPENKTYRASSVPLNFTVNESASWMRYSLDGQENETITGNTTLTNLTNGSHNIIVYARDDVGNEGASKKVYFTLSFIHEFTLVTLYVVHLDLNETFSEGSNLTVMFYNYMGEQEANTTIGNTTPPDVDLTINITHPLNKPVENATLVLTDDLGTILQTVTSFVVHRPDLMGRLGELDYLWTVPGADRTAIMKEYVAIDGQWPYAPP